MIRVGIPSSLFYFYYFPLWKTFFTDLGAEVICSPRTTRLTIDAGINTAVDETCLPIKVHLGHVRLLAAQNLDYLFAPRVVSIEAKSYICPKFMGIPDMIRACIPNTPELIDITVDLSRGDKEFSREVEQVGRLFTRHRGQIRDAYQHGCEEMDFCRALAKQGYTLSEVIDIWQGDFIQTDFSGDIQVGLLGHGYSLYDDTLSLNLVNRLRNMGCRVILPEALAADVIEEEARTMPKRVFWTLGRKMVGSAFSMEKRADIDGIIYVACFGCGPDSFIGEIIERKVKNKPFMLITIDEHTGEGGLVTRLEAFCDMLRRRRDLNHESNLSAHG